MALRLGANQGDPVNAPNLTAWLLEQIEADEVVARAAGGASGAAQWRVVEADYEGISVWESRDPTPAGFTYGFQTDVTAHMELHDPARVLRECAAKRTIVEAHALEHECPYSGVAGGAFDPCETILALASVYADRDGYAEAVT